MFSLPLRLARHRRQTRTALKGSLNRTWPERAVAIGAAAAFWLALILALFAGLGDVKERKSIARFDRLLAGLRVHEDSQASFVKALQAPRSKS